MRNLPRRITGVYFVFETETRFCYRAAGAV